MNAYKTEQEIESVVSGFEQCSTAKDEFKHHSHLTVAVYYLRHLSNEEAVAKMRDGLFRFLHHHGIDRAKYDEQLTRDWFNLVQTTMEETDSRLSLLEITNLVLEKLKDSRMIVRRTD